MHLACGQQFNLTSEWTRRQNVRKQLWHHVKGVSVRWVLQDRAAFSALWMKNPICPKHNMKNLRIIQACIITTRLQAMKHWIRSYVHLKVEVVVLGWTARLTLLGKMLPPGGERSFVKKYLKNGQPENSRLSPAQVSKALCIVIINVVLKFTFQFLILKISRNKINKNIRWNWS